MKAISVDDDGGDHARPWLCHKCYLCLCGICRPDHGCCRRWKPCKLLHFVWLGPWGYRLAAHPMTPPARWQCLLAISLRASRGTCKCKQDKACSTAWTVIKWTSLDLIGQEETSKRNQLPNQVWTAISTLVHMVSTIPWNPYGEASCPCTYH